MVRSLFLLPFVSNPGYAISALEILFYQAGLELATGNPSFVHFGYVNFQGGPPKFLPQGFANLIEFDFGNTDPKNIQQIEFYVRKNGIQFVLIFDIQPVHPLFRSLRKAGASAIITYWGAPISSQMPIWKQMLKRLEIALSRSKVDGMIFESKAMAHLAIYGRGVPRDVIDIVPLGVDTTVFKPECSYYAHEALGLPRDKKIVIYSGHMEQRKGIHTLVEAAIELLTKRRRKDVCFLICGNRDDNESREYRLMYEGKNIDHLIRFGGYRSDLVRLYPSCFCGVIPSTGWDSFPRTSLEMAASGLPVVASRLHGLTEAILNQKTGLLFEPGNAWELANCLESLLDQPELAARYGREGRERCETEFNLDVQRQRFLTVVYKYLQSPKAIVPQSKLLAARLIL